MFNLSKEIDRLKQLRHDKIHGKAIVHQRRHGLPNKPKQIDGMLYDIQAQQESIAISNGFKNKSTDFGRRLSKAKGQRHHPGGGFAGCTIKQY